MSGFLGKVGAFLGGGAAQPAAGAESSENQWPEDLTYSDDPCSGCADPCETHPQLPGLLQLKINTSKPLLGSVKPYDVHVLVSFGTGQNWPRKVDKTPGNLVHGLATGLKAARASDPAAPSFLVTACDRTGGADGEASDVIVIGGPWKDGRLLPSIAVGPPIPLTDREQMAHLEQLTTSLATRVLDGPSLPPSQPLFSSGPLKQIVLVCTHKLRDKRCGVAGPMLVEAFQGELRERNMTEQVHVYGVSHFGGHKFAGNVIIYPLGVWYGRVRTCHVKSIVDTTLVGGAVVRELFRGKMGQSQPADKTW